MSVNDQATIVPESLPGPLTVERLRKLPWTTMMHLNAGATHHLQMVNDEFGLLLASATDKKTNRYVERRVISIRKGGIACDLLADDFQAELARFVDAYNAAFPVLPGRLVATGRSSAPIQSDPTTQEPRHG